MAIGAFARAVARLVDAGMPREVAERVVRGEMPPALPDRAPPRLTFSTDNPKAIGAIPNILNFVDDPAYQILEKDLIPELVMMSPDEYISEASRILSRQSPGDIDFDNVVRSRTQDMEYLQGIQDLLDQGTDFQVPFLDYKRGGQEGLHRAIAARSLGEEQIPVMIMRSARGDNLIPLTQAEQDAINAAKLEELRAKGYPEPTIEKIMRRELSMSPEARGYRAYKQGKKTRLYHAGSPELATATELDPDAGRFARAGSGTWMTQDPVLANTYVPAGAENAGTMYEFLVDDSQFPMFVGSGNWDEVIGDLIGPRPEYKTLLEDVSGSTNDIARQVREMGYPGMFFTGVSDVGPNYQAAKRSAEMLADRDRMDPKELLEGTIGDRAETPDVYTIFDPSVARSPLAAFDPDQVDSPNLMAGLGPAAIGAGLFGASMAPEEAEAAGAAQAGQDEVPDYMRRLDGSIKSQRGFLGPIRNNVSGRTMTEVSIGQPGSEEGFYPLLVPTLTQEEIDTIANLDLGRERPPQAIIEKARAHAMDRIARGLSPFYQDGEDGSFGEYDARTAQRLGQELDRLMQLAEIRRQPSIEPLDDTAMARVGDYLLEDRPSEMDTLQRALQRLDMGQGLGDYLQTTGQGDPTTIMQDLLAGLDIFDVLGLLPGAGKASSAAVRAAQRGN